MIISAASIVFALLLGTFIFLILPRGRQWQRATCPYRKLDSSVAVMQAAEYRLGNDATKAFDRSADRRILG